MEEQVICEGRNPSCPAWCYHSVPHPLYVTGMASRNVGFCNATKCDEIGRHVECIPPHTKSKVGEKTKRTKRVRVVRIKKR